VLYVMAHCPVTYHFLFEPGAMNTVFAVCGNRLLVSFRCITGIEKFS
jgi:hypothetical protein